MASFGSSNKRESSQPSYAVGKARTRRCPVFADAVVAGAIVDRLLHTAAVMNIRGASYRARVYAAKQKLKGGGAMVA